MYQLKMSGDFRRLERFMHKVQTLPGQRTKWRVALLEESIELVREGFATGTDPYGKPWAPLKLRQGQPLRDKGGLQNWRRRGFFIEPTKFYAVFHQGGTGIYGPNNKRIEPIKARALRIPVGGGVIFARSVGGAPKRRMVPEPGPLPSAWRKRFVALTREMMAAHFK